MFEVVADETGRGPPGVPGGGRVAAAGGDGERAVDQQDELVDELGIRFGVRHREQLADQLAPRVQVRSRGLAGGMVGVAELEGCVEERAPAGSGAPGPSRTAPMASNNARTGGHASR